MIEMMRAAILLFGIGVTVVSLSCAPKVLRYEYISLENTPGVRVTARGIPRIHGLRNASSMPLSYSLERPRYTLRIDANVQNDNYAGSLRVKVMPKQNDGALILKAQRARKARKDRPAPCGGYYPIVGSPHELDFGWGGCADDTEGERFISFDVARMDGTIEGVEDIPFEVVTNGYYIVMDGT